MNFAERSTSFLVPHIDGNSGLKFENSALAYHAAIDELGIVMAQYAFVADDLRSGRLVAPLTLRRDAAILFYAPSGAP